MSNFIPSQSFHFEYLKKDLLVQIDSVKSSINLLENTIYDHPELLFNRLSLEDNSVTKIILKIKENERYLTKLNEELQKINAHLLKINTEQRDGVDYITNQMKNFSI